MSCIKKNTILSKDEEIKWYAWLHIMKNETEWTNVSNSSVLVKVCYECSGKFASTIWSNPISYEINNDKVVPNSYCEDCYKEWNRDTLGTY